MKICVYSCRYQNQKFSLVSHSFCSCSTRFALMSFVSTRVALVLHSCPSCLTRVARVALVSHSFPSYRTYVVPVWHLCCKLDWICELLSFISKDNFEKIFKIFFVHWDNSKSSHFNLRQFRTFLIFNRYWKEVEQILNRYLLDQKLNWALGKLKRQRKFNKKKNLCYKLLWETPWIYFKLISKTKLRTLFDNKF